MYFVKPKFVVLVVLLALTFGCSSDKQLVVFSISGNVKNPKPGKIILAQEENINRKRTKFIDEIKVDSDGGFRLDLDLEPHIYTIDFYGEKKLALAIDKGQKVVIKADANDLENFEVSGSEDTAKLQAYEKFRVESLERLVKSVRKKLKDSGKTNDPNAEEVGRLEVENYEKHKAELNEFIKNEMGDSIAIYATTLRWDGEENVGFFETISSAFEKRHGEIEVAKRLREKVELLKRTSIGGTAPEIEIPDKDGKVTSLDASKAKYTLIDFWASWCGPCRRESKNVAALYEKYKSQGLEIYGVSLDTDREKWLAALEKDGRVWTNVSSLKGFDTPATFEYAVTALPAKFLIDSDGKIVARNLHGKDLETKIDQLLSE